MLYIPKSILGDKMNPTVRLGKLFYESSTGAFGLSSSHVSDQIGDRSPLPTHENQSLIDCWRPEMCMRASATNFELSLT